jgi:hypothetical protein
MKRFRRRGVCLRGGDAVGRERRPLEVAPGRRELSGHVVDWIERGEVDLVIAVGCDPWQPGGFSSSPAAP